MFANGLFKFSLDNLKEEYDDSPKRLIPRTVRRVEAHVDDKQQRLDDNVARTLSKVIVSSDGASSKRQQHALASYDSKLESRPSKSGDDHQERNMKTGNSWVQSLGKALTAKRQEQRQTVVGEARRRDDRDVESFARTLEGLLVTSEGQSEDVQTDKSPTILPVAHPQTRVQSSQDPSFSKIVSGMSRYVREQAANLPAAMSRMTPKDVMWLVIVSFVAFIVARSVLTYIGMLLPDFSSTNMIDEQIRAEEYSVQLRERTIRNDADGTTDRRVLDGRL